jgi:hypothetical protein
MANTVHRSLESLQRDHDDEHEYPIYPGPGHDHEESWRERQQHFVDELALLQKIADAHGWEPTEFGRGLGEIDCGGE